MPRFPETARPQPVSLQPASPPALRQQQAKSLQLQPLLPPFRSASPPGSPPSWCPAATGSCSLARSSCLLCCRGSGACAACSSWVSRLLPPPVFMPISLLHATARCLTCGPAHVLGHEERLAAAWVRCCLEVTQGAGPCLPEQQGLAVVQTSGITAVEWTASSEWT